MLRLSSFLLLVPFLLGCYPQYTILEHQDITLPAGERPTIVVEMHNGPISISTAQCKDITGQLTKRGVGADKEEAEKEIKVLDFETGIVNGKVVVIKVKRLDGSKSWNSSGGEATLQVPHNSKLELITTNASVKVTGKTDGVKVKSSNGSVNLANILAPVEVNTSNGGVRCTDVIGTARIDTSNGSVDIRGANMILDCKSNNAGITCTGDLAPGDHKVISSNGQITLMLPRDIVLSIDASTSNSRVTSDFNLSKNESSGKKKNTTLKGVIGSGDPSRSLLVKTSNGSISIKREKTASPATTVE